MVKTTKIKVKSIENQEIIMTITMTKRIIINKNNKNNHDNNDENENKNC